MIKCNFKTAIRAFGKCTHPRLFLDRFFLKFLSERISRSDRQLMLSKHQHLILEINEIGSEGSS